MSRTSPFSKAETTLRKAALAFPETREDHPWGECAFKVREKVFLFLAQGEAELSLSMKLPQSRDFALLMPFARPTGYGLGKSGWVTALFGPEDVIPLPMLLDWMEESFCAVAPKKVAAGRANTSAPAPLRKR
ncbi:MAG TPA: DifB protein, partial [Holophagaceae bacterium]|nr:DifB protein [Holophagaceae bacterium]